MKPLVLRVLAMIFLTMFAAVWIWIGVKLLQFNPTPLKPKLDLPNDWVDFAGFLSSAVAAGTAAVLGIQIQKPSDTAASSASGSVPATVKFAKGAAGESKFLVIGIAVYAVVGLFVAVVWFTHTAEAPDMIRAFSWGIIGWLAGAFAAVFHTTAT